MDIKTGINKVCEICNKDYYVPKRHILTNLGCSAICGNKISFKLKVLNYNWDEINKFYKTNRLIITEKKYKLTKAILNEAIKLMLFKKEKKKIIRTNEEKNNLSIKRKEYLLNNPDKHPWRKNSKFISKPCEELKSFLIINNIKFIEEYKALDKFNYSLDIAFPDKLLALEINGNQHYDKHGNLNEYYIKREKIFNDNGWTTVQIHYPLCYNLQYKNELLDIINNVKKLNDFSYKDYKPLIKEKINKAQIKKEKYDNKQKEYIKILLNSNIAFEIFGWVNRVSIIINQKPQKVNKWMKKYMFDFYKEKCFKRNGSIV